MSQTCSGIFIKKDGKMVVAGDEHSGRLHPWRRLPSKNEKWQEEICGLCRASNVLFEDKNQKCSVWLFKLRNDKAIKRSLWLQTIAISGGNSDVIGSQRRRCAAKKNCLLMLGSTMQTPFPPWKCCEKTPQCRKCSTNRKGGLWMHEQLRLTPPKCKWINMRQNEKFINNSISIETLKCFCDRDTTVSLENKTSQKRHLIRTLF